MGIAAFMVRPLQERMLAQTMSSARLFANETTAPQGAVGSPGAARYLDSPKLTGLGLIEVTAS